MRAVDIIVKKRDGGRLTRDEIRRLIAGYVDGTVADYQMAAWAMAVVLRGMDDAETSDLTLAMAESGDMLDLHDIAPLTVDKHSTGGVGDKTSLVLGPMCAAIGLPVAKMSGRGLGFSGGTLDKLESIPGFRVDLTPAEFRRAVVEVGLVIAGQSANLAPADKQLYALRDVTGTVDSIPLIAASVMSKKLAAGADCIVLDVKAGRGAFMKTVEDARALARTMVAIGRTNGRKMAAAITSMEQPLGLAIGNALEVREAIETLRGQGPDDLADICLTLGAQLALLAGKVESADEGRALLRATIEEGTAWDKWRAMVANQGGDLDMVDHPERLASAAHQEPIRSPRAGYIAAIDAQALGTIVGRLGGGRQRKDDRIDPAVGIVLERKAGARVEKGDALAVLHTRTVADAEQARERLLDAWSISHDAVSVPPLVYDIVS
jgi:pyrimidine-nucleoside phosphorylase